jgi:hypothetical protein
MTVNNGSSSARNARKVLWFGMCLTVVALVFEQYMWLRPTLFEGAWIDGVVTPKGALVVDDAKSAEQKPQAPSDESSFPAIAVIGDANKVDPVGASWSQLDPVGAAVATGHHGNADDVADHVNDEAIGTDGLAIERAQIVQNGASVVDDNMNRQLDKWKRSLPCIKKWVQSTTRKYHSEAITKCNDDWAYIHVLKAGGTTVQRQCRDKNSSIHSEAYKTHKMFTFVRDPVSHFIAGFKECAARHEPRRMKFQATNESLREWLFDYRKFWCFQHSVPQIEFLLYHHGGKSEPLRFLDQLQFVGDKEDMKRFFQQKKLPWKDSRIERHKSRIKNALNITADNIDNSTLLQICNFTKIDYCFFDYEPPAVCEHMIKDYCIASTNAICPT